MLVILRENVEHLGRTGDVIKVKDGYARNFLLPRRLVVVADETNMKSLEHNKKVYAKRRAEQKATAEDAAGKLKEYSCTIKRKSGEHDKLFGSVTTADIAVELKKGGFEVDRKAIHLKDAIKTLGVHPITVKLPPDVEVTVKVWVVKEE